MVFRRFISVLTLSSEESLVFKPVNLNPAESNTAGSSKEGTSTGTVPHTAVQSVEIPTKTPLKSAELLRTAGGAHRTAERSAGVRCGYIDHRMNICSCSRPRIGGVTTAASDLLITR